MLPRKPRNCQRKITNAEASCSSTVRYIQPLVATSKWPSNSGTAKPVTVKAKSSNNEAHKLGGLVVNPHLCPEAFKGDRVNDAKKTWRTWHAPSGIKCVEEGEYRGLVLLDGKAIFADYDLLDVAYISRINGTALEFESPREAADLVKYVTRAFNTAAGIDMILHGPETHFSGMGTTGKENVLSFGPGRQMKWELPELFSPIWTKGVHLYRPKPRK